MTGDSDCARFAAKLLQVGNGNIPYLDTDQTVALPKDFGTYVTSLDSLKKSVYPNLTSNLQNGEWLKDRAILAPKTAWWTP